MIKMHLEADSWAATHGQRKKSLLDVKTVVEDP